MALTRRDLHLLLPAIVAIGANAQDAGRKPLASRVYQNNGIEYRSSPSKKGRQFFAGVNRSAFGVEVHETILTPGTETHAPHKHLHEEIVIVTEGVVQIFIEGKTEKAEAGSVVYIASNELHNARNIGDVPSRYYVMELRGDRS